MNKCILTLFPGYFVVIIIIIVENSDFCFFYFFMVLMYKPAVLHGYHSRLDAQEIPGGTI